MPSHDLCEGKPSSLTHIWVTRLRWVASDKLQSDMNDLTPNLLGISVTSKMRAMTSQITCVSIVYSNVWSGADQRKHQSTSKHLFPSSILYRALLFNLCYVWLRPMYFVFDVCVDLWTIKTIKKKQTSKLRVTGLCNGEFTGHRWITLTKIQ